LRQLHPDTEILFVGAEGRMEMQKVPEAGYAIEGLQISGIQRRLSLDNLSFPLKLIRSVRKAGAIVKRFRPDAVVGVGGYASGPLMFAATRRGIPGLLQEQNGYAGLTNKWLAKWVKTICVAYPHMEQYFPASKLIFTGNPVRKDIQQLDKLREEALAHYGFSPDKKVLLVIGGSGGARTLNEGIKKDLAVLQEAGIQLIWQTGKFYYDKLVQELGEQPGEHIRMQPFINEMKLAYAAADVVVSRAGALSISELCLAAKPAVLVPSPNVAEDHQTKNALTLVQEGAAVLVKDADAAAGRLVPEALSLLKDEAKQATLIKNISKLAKPEAAKQIAEEVIKLIP
jgi:UDP-N-acetylglucosamine--N-acetylmuramyl-(pentapeptide) pyrophosphoryl-undecaprenol N-acetylglucosamine transferase